MIFYNLYFLYFQRIMRSHQHSQRSQRRRRSIAKVVAGQGHGLSMKPKRRIWWSGLEDTPSRGSGPPRTTIKRKMHGETRLES